MGFLRFGGRQPFFSGGQHLPLPDKLFFQDSCFLFLRGQLTAEGEKSIPGRCHFPGPLILFQAAANFHHSFPAGFQLFQTHTVICQLPEQSRSYRRLLAMLIQPGQFLTAELQPGAVRFVLFLNPVAEGPFLRRCGGGSVFLNQGKRLVKRTVRLRHYPAAVIGNVRADRSQLSGQLFRLFAQIQLQIPVDAGAEDSPEDFRPFIAAGQQQAKKFSLGQHTQLFELLVIEAQNFGYPFGDFKHFGYRGTVRQNQFSLRWLPGEAISTFFGTAVFRPPRDRVDFSPVLEAQRDKRIDIRPGKIAAQAVAAPVLTAGFTEQRIRYAVKDGGFSRPGVAGDQKQSGSSQPGKVHFAKTRIGTEGAHG